MNPASELLHASVRRVAAATAEVQATDELAGVLERTVESAAAAMDEGERFVPSELAEKLDEAGLARMLRTILGEAIELFRRELPSLECSESVLCLRSVLHPAIPRPPADSADVKFFRRLLEGDCTDLDDDHCRMVGLFKDLSLNLNDIIYVHDLNGTLLYLSEPGLMATEYTPEDLVAGLSVYDLVVPEFVDTVEARLETPGAVSRAPYTSEIYTKEGDRVPVEITSRCIMREGRIAGIIGIARDLRLARRLEHQITRLNACMDGLLDGLPLGVVFATSQTIIEDANPAAVSLFGAPNLASLAGMPLSRACNEEQPVLGEVLTGAMKEGRPTRLRYGGTSHFGADLEVDLTVIPVRPLDNRKMFLIVMSDLSSGPAGQADMDQTEKLSALGEIVGGIAHELNNPLTGILGYAQLLLNSQLEPAVRSRVEHVAKEAERCKNLVHNLFTFAHTDKSEKLPLDVNDIMSNVLSLREYQFHVDGIDVHAALQPGLPEVMANTSDLQRVFLSFLINAQQALNTVEQQEKRLDVKTCARDGGVCIEFMDNGPGIPKCIQSKIFDPFFSTKGVGGGAGLGLSVAYGLIRSHGGSVAVESEEGAGARFMIRLPVREAEAKRPGMRV